MWRTILSFAVIFFFLRRVDGAKILGIFPNPGYSQFLLGNTLMLELSRRGHDVTVISPFKEKNPPDNYTPLETEGLVDIIKKESLFELESANIIQSIISIQNYGYQITEYILADGKVQELLNSNKQFDLVLCEQFFNEAHYGFAHHFKAPLVLFSSIGLSEWNNHLTSNPMPLSYIPNSFLGYSGHMTYFQRILNAIIYGFDLVYKHVVAFPWQNALLNQYFPNPPRLNEIIYNSSLVLLNANPAMTINAPFVPNMIPIGGFHVQPKKLPPELQKFLDDAKEGAIYFSLGSNLKTSQLNEEKLEAFLNAFARLKQKVLWKWEEDRLVNMPKNIYVSKWFPQMDILGHPNIQAFITHGGLLSTTEAIYHGVPMIGIPIYGDQKMNMAVSSDNGVAIVVPFRELSEARLSEALDEVLNNSKYKENAKFRSKILNDQPIKPLDNAMFWIEYVLRYNNTDHLKVPGFYLDWYQYWFLDWLVLLGPLVAILWAVFLVLVYLIIKWYNQPNLKVKKA